MQTDYLQRAAHYCSLAEHCSSEVILKLRQWGCNDTDEQEQIVDYLIKENYLNDERYCRAYIHDKLNYQGWGEVKIRSMLNTKALPQHIVYAALKEIDETVYINTLARLIKQKSKNIKGDNSQQKLFRFALSRGFTYQQIKQVIGDCYSE